MSDMTQDPRRDVIVALTRSGTLYAAVPRGNARYVTRRCRVAGRSGQREGTFEGVLLSVRQLEPPVGGGVETVRCGDLVLAPVAGSYGRPVPGERMAVGGDSRGVEEVSSRVQWVAVMDIDRSWAVEPMVRAFRNGARDWRSFMTEQPYEQGDEHIDDDTGSLRAGVLERNYRDYLLDQARRRDEHMRRLGHHVLPTHRPVSNEELVAHLARLSADLAGAGMEPLPLPARRKHRAAIGSSLERCWGAVRRMGVAAMPLERAA